MQNLIIYLLLNLISGIHSAPSQKIDEHKIAAALAFCKSKRMDTSICVMIDMSIASGRNRIFVWDFKKKAIVIEGLCAHGVGKGSTTTKIVFSNEIGSNCTSLGKYKLGARAYSNWGINVHYKMHGLEKTNNNAYKRIVVLHSYDPIPSSEIYPATLFGQSAGCPVVANAFMTKIDKLLQSKNKPVLLWIYE